MPPDTWMQQGTVGRVGDISWTLIKKAHFKTPLVIQGYKWVGLDNVLTYQDFAPSKTMAQAFWRKSVDYNMAGERASFRLVKIPL